MSTYRRKKKFLPDGVEFDDFADDLALHNRVDIIFVRFFFIVVIILLERR